MDIDKEAIKFGRIFHSLQVEAEPEEAEEQPEETVVEDESEEEE